MISAAKEVVADAFDYRTGANPLIAGLIRIKIVDGTAGGVGAVEGFLGGPLGGLVDFLIDLAIGDGSEGPRLVDDPGNGVREGRMLHTVEYYSAYSNLADIGLSPGFCGDDAGQQLVIAVRDAAPGRDGLRDPQSF